MSMELSRGEGDYVETICAQPSANLDFAHTVLQSYWSIKIQSSFDPINNFSELA